MRIRHISNIRSSRRIVISACAGVVLFLSSACASSVVLPAQEPDKTEKTPSCQNTHAQQDVGTIEATTKSKPTCNEGEIALPAESDAENTSIIPHKLEEYRESYSHLRFDNVLGKNMNESQGYIPCPSTSGSSLTYQARNLRFDGRNSTGDRQLLFDLEANYTLPGMAILPVDIGSRYRNITLDRNAVKVDVLTTPNYLVLNHGLFNNAKDVAITIKSIKLDVSDKSLKISDIETLYLYSNLDCEDDIPCPRVFEDYPEDSMVLRKEHNIVFHKDCTRLPVPVVQDE